MPIQLLEECTLLASVVSGAETDLQLNHAHVSQPHVLDSVHVHEHCPKDEIYLQ